MLTKKMSDPRRIRTSGERGAGHPALPPMLGGQSGPLTPPCPTSAAISTPDGERLLRRMVHRRVNRGVAEREASSFGHPQIIDQL